MEGLHSVRGGGVVHKYEEEISAGDVSFDDVHVRTTAVEIEEFLDDRSLSPSGRGKSSTTRSARISECRARGIKAVKKYVAADKLVEILHDDLVKI